MKNWWIEGGYLDTYEIVVIGILLVLFIVSVVYDWKENRINK